jgi:hypothetical protein
MRKTLVALAAVATLAVSAVAAPAHAQRGLGAAVAGGLIGGAIVGGAIAASPYGYGPGYYGYGPGYGYGGPAYVVDDGCYWQRQRFWDGYGWRIRRIRVCGWPPFIFIKASDCPKTVCFRERLRILAWKNRFSGQCLEGVYFGLTIVRFSSDRVNPSLACESS